MKGLLLLAGALLGLAAAQQNASDCVPHGTSALWKNFVEAQLALRACLSKGKS